MVRKGSKYLPWLWLYYDLAMVNTYFYQSYLGIYYHIYVGTVKIY